MLRVCFYELMLLPLLHSFCHVNSPFFDFFPLWTFYLGRQLWRELEACHDIAFPQKGCGDILAKSQASCWFLEGGLSIPAQSVVLFYSDSNRRQAWVLVCVHSAPGGWPKGKASSQMAALHISWRSAESDVPGPPVGLPGRKRQMLLGI